MVDYAFLSLNMTYMATGRSAPGLTEVILEYMVGFIFSHLWFSKFEFRSDLKIITVIIVPGLIHAQCAILIYCIYTFTHNSSFSCLYNVKFNYISSIYFIFI